MQALKRTVGVLVAGFAAGGLTMHRFQSKRTATGDSQKEEEDTTYKVPGAKMSLKTHGLEQGANMLQKFAPINKIHMHVCGFHCYSGDLKRQVTAHHYCSHINDDVAQCVIYDSDGPHAKLIGIEYIISEKIYSSLPDEEKKLWHSHVCEVKSGLLVGLSLPQTADKALMKDLINTYGKTFHTWQVDRGDPLPFGIPQLMMAFTEEGQVRKDLVEKRDKDFGISTAEYKKLRADIKDPQIDKFADYWYQGGKATQLKSEEFSYKP